MEHYLPISSINFQAELRDMTPTYQIWSDTLFRILRHILRTLSHYKHLKFLQKPKYIFLKWKRNDGDHHKKLTYLSFLKTMNLLNSCCNTFIRIFKTKSWFPLFTAYQLNSSKVFIHLLKFQQEWNRIPLHILLSQSKLWYKWDFLILVQSYLRILWVIPFDPFSWLFLKIQLEFHFSCSFTIFATNLSETTLFYFHFPFRIKIIIKTSRK